MSASTQHRGYRGPGDGGMASSATKPGQPLPCCRGSDPRPGLSRLEKRQVPATRQGLHTEATASPPLPSGAHPVRARRQLRGFPARLRGTRDRG